MNQQLNEIKEALSRATPGPWEKRADAVKGSQGWVCQMFEGDEKGDFPTKEFDNAYSNAHLIANAPQWLASLVDKVERLEYAIQIVEADRDNWLQECGKLHRQVEEMQKTLEWYADKDRYISKPTDADFTEWDAPEANEDGGERARQTLQSLKGDKP